MIITIFGASGMVGRYLVATALDRGHKVKAFGRNVEPLSTLNNSNLTTVTGELFNENHVSGVVKNSDAVISALGGDFSGVEKTRSKGIDIITKAMAEHNVKRIIAIGGAGILEVQQGVMFMDTDGFNKQFLPVSEEHRKAYQTLRSSQLDWTFFCPPTILNEAASHSYQIKAEGNPDKSNFTVKAGDLAEAIVRELEENQLVNKRVGIASY